MYPSEHSPAQFSRNPDFGFDDLSPEELEEYDEWREETAAPWTDEELEDCYLQYRLEHPVEFTLSRIIDSDDSVNHTAISQKQKGRKAMTTHYQPNIRKANTSIIRDRFRREMELLNKSLPVREEDIPVNTSRIVVVKLATTGSDTYADEIIQLTLVDGNGRILLDTLVKPQWNLTWPEAEKIDGITPAMTANAPTAEELSYYVRCIFASADTIVSYNWKDFDRLLLQPWYVVPRDNVYPVDLMTLISHLHGEYNEEFHNHKYMSRAEAVKYYEDRGYEKYFLARQRNKKYDNANITKAEDNVFLLRALSHDPEYKKSLKKIS